jgi:hypothetical protein
MKAWSRNSRRKRQTRHAARLGLDVLEAREVMGVPAGTGALSLWRFRTPIGQHKRLGRGFLIDPMAASS